MATYTTTYKQPVNVIPGFDTTTSIQALDTPIYNQATNITVPYTGGTPDIGSTFKVSVKTGTNTRDLLSSEFAVTGASSPFQVVIDADVFDPVDVVSGVVGLEFDYAVTVTKP